MKKYLELMESEVVVETPEGEIRGIVSELRQGAGDEKYMVTLVLITNHRPPEGQCYVEFNDKKYGAIFENIMTAKAICKSDLQTIINDPTFWE